MSDTNYSQITKTTNANALYALKGRGFSEEVGLVTANTPPTY